MTSPTPQPPGYVRWAAGVLEDAGYETWVVGGAVRNTLLGLPAPEWDLATRAPPTAVRRHFPRTVPVGIEHGTVGILTREGVLLEVTTFRKDVETFGRHAVVEFADTLREDLARRDFTVNAVAWHPLNGEFADPFGGREDLKRGLLRTVGDPGERFAEDYLRVLRALRFSGRLRFRIHSDTWRALLASTGELGILSPERVREELMKILTQAPFPSRALSLYRISGVLGALYPEVEEAVGCPRTGTGEDLWTHALLLTDHLSARRPLLRLAAFLQGVGLPRCGGAVGEPPISTRWGVEEGILARERTAALLIRLRFSNAEIRQVSEMMGVGMEPPLHLRGGAELRRWLNLASPEGFPVLARIWAAKARLDRARWGRDPSPTLELISRARDQLRSGAPLTLQELAFDGRALISMGLKPGPHFGEILTRLMDVVLEDPAKNEAGVLREVVERWLEGEEGGEA